MRSELLVGDEVLAVPAPAGRFGDSLGRGDEHQVGNVGRAVVGQLPNVGSCFYVEA